MPIEITNPRFFPGNISGFGLEQTERGCVVDTAYGVNVASAEGCLLLDHPAPGLANLALSLKGTVNGLGDSVSALYLIPPNQAAHITTQLVDMLARVSPDVATRLIGELNTIAQQSTRPAEPEPEQAPDPTPPDPPAEPPQPAPDPDPEPGPAAPHDHRRDLPQPPNPLEEFMVPVHRADTTPGDDPNPTLVDPDPPREHDEVAERRARHPMPHDMEAPASRTA